MIETTDQMIDINLGAMRARMSDREYREKYCKLDFLELAEQQWRVVRSPYRWTLAQAGNQTGKTVAGAARTVAHILRRQSLLGPTAYPLAPLRTNSGLGSVVWILSNTNVMVRDNAQAVLLGNVAGGEIGTGLLPGDRIISHSNAHGLTGLVDTCLVRADDGSTTALRFLSLDQARHAMQGQNCSALWIDELPTGSDAEEQWNELIARTTVSGGCILLTATPARQGSPVMRFFKEPNKSDRGTIRMSIFETRHITSERVKAMEQAYTDRHQRTRLYGDEYSGGGLVLQATKEMCGHDRTVEKNTHEYMLRIIGLDPHHGGLSATAHPSAIVYAIWNSSDDSLWVYGGFKQQHISPESLVARVKQTSWANAPCAWGRAEAQGTGGNTGEAYFQMYRRLGLKMLPDFATLPGGSLSLDITFDEIQNAMTTGRLKIANTFYELWDEVNTLERDDDNRIIQNGPDDLLAALRYAWLDRKKARVAPLYDRGAFDDIGGSTMRLIQPNHPPEFGE